MRAHAPGISAVRGRMSLCSLSHSWPSLSANQNCRIIVRGRLFPFAGLFKRDQ
jgi:hypothetical protein